jgi:hypothetical protein
MSALQIALLCPDLVRTLDLVVSIRIPSRICNAYTFMAMSKMPGAGLGFDAGGLVK